jgi:hypothetical protein
MTGHQALTHRLLFDPDRPHGRATLFLLLCRRGPVRPDGRSGPVPSGPPNRRRNEPETAPTYPASIERQEAPAAAFSGFSSIRGLSPPSIYHRHHPPPGSHGCQSAVGPPASISRRGSLAREPDLRAVRRRSTAWRIDRWVENQPLFRQTSRLGRSGYWQGGGIVCGNDQVCAVESKSEMSTELVAENFAGAGRPLPPENPLAFWISEARRDDFFRDRWDDRRDASFRTFAPACLTLAKVENLDQSGRAAKQHRGEESLALSSATQSHD